MGKLSEKASDWLNDFMRRMCGRINPDRRVVVIAVLFVLFAAVNLWVTFRGIYSIGRGGDRIEQIELPPDVSVPETEQEPPDELQLEIEEFLNKHFNYEQNDTTTIQ